MTHSRPQSMRPEVALPDDQDEVVAVSINAFVAPLAPGEWRTTSVEWRCRNCGLSGEALTVPEAQAQLGEHLFRHCRRGPGNVMQ